MTTEIHDALHPADRYGLAMVTTTKDAASGLRGRFWLQGAKEDNAVAALPVKPNETSGGLIYPCGLL
jgi:hypothetical protein